MPKLLAAKSKPNSAYNQISKYIGQLVNRNPCFFWQRLIAVNYFQKKALSWMFDWDLNTRLDTAHCFYNYTNIGWTGQDLQPLY